ncbi:MAG: helix-turn-helix domain-containing protein [Desulfohalobiaceae bacterium]|nr:helix-turn-helix domain-containing protein [Desulfohalobiaceae bacterium]
MIKQFKTLEKLAQAIVKADPRVIEVIIHQDTPNSPLASDEVFLVCYLNHYGITNDLTVYEEEAFSWGIDIYEKVAGRIAELGLSEKEIIITPFNFDLHRQNEYGKYFRSLFIQDGYEPILSIADRELKKREQDFGEEIEAYDTGLDESDDSLPAEKEAGRDYSVSEVVEATGINKRTLQGYLKTGKLQGYKKGNRWYIPETELEKFQGITA